MGLRHYLRVVVRRWWLVVLCVLVGAGAVLLVTSLQVKLYQASVTYFLADSGGTPAAGLDSAAAAARISTYSTLAESPSMMRTASEAIGGSPGHAAATASSGGGPIFMRVDLQADSAAGAFKLAEAYAEQFPDFVARFQGVPAASSPIGVFQRPTVPTSPVSPNVSRDVAAAAALALLVGIVGAFAVDYVDQSVRSGEEAKSLTGLGLLASIPKDNRSEATFRSATPGTDRAEAIRQLRTNVRFAGVDKRLRSLVITSPGSAEGKTSVAVDLSIASAKAGQRVLLVDADLRRPTVASALGLEGAAGLTNLLLDDASLEDVVQPWGDEVRLDVLASGPIPANPSELLGFDRMRKLVDELVSRYELVIFDSPPVLPVTDATVLSQIVDGVVVVARVRSTRRDRLRRTVERLSALKLRLIGVVANGTPRVDESYVRYQVGRHRNEPTVAPLADVRAPATASDEG